MTGDTMVRCECDNCGSDVFVIFQDSETKRVEIECDMCGADLNLAGIKIPGAKS